MFDINWASGIVIPLILSAGSCVAFLAIMSLVDAIFKAIYKHRLEKKMMESRCRMNTIFVLTMPTPIVEAGRRLGVGDKTTICVGDWSHTAEIVNMDLDSHSGIYEYTLKKAGAV